MSAQFHNLQRLDTRYIDGKDILVVSDGFGFTDSTGRTVAIPKLVQGGQVMGFLSDGGTIPRFAWPLAGHPFGRWLPAFLIHDFDWSFRSVDFASTNTTLHEALATLGCPWITRKEIVGAVRVAGWPTWRSGAARDRQVDWHYGVIAA